MAPTDRPINDPPERLAFSFDPSSGPGYVWHCHIVDHEDMSMMRPLDIVPSPMRVPQVTVQPVPAIVCAGDLATFSVMAASVTKATYQWEVSTDAGLTWTKVPLAAPYANTTSTMLNISTGPAFTVTGNLYRCVVTNAQTSVTSNSASLTVNNCSVSGVLSYNNPLKTPLAGFTVSVNGIPAALPTDATGAFTVSGVTSGSQLVTVNQNLIAAGGINATDAGKLNSWLLNPTTLTGVHYLAGNVNKDLALNGLDPEVIQKNFVDPVATPFGQAPWVFSDAAITGFPNSPDIRVTVNGTSVTGFGILGMSTGDFNASYNPVPPASSVVFGASGLNLTVPIGAPFDLPVKSVTMLQVGAVSLILNVPSTLVTVNNVTVPGSTAPVIWSYTANVLKIAWNSTAPVTVNPGGNLFVITMTPQAAFTTNQTLKLTMVPSYLNEIADGSFIPFIGPALTVDNVKVTVKTNTVLPMTLTVTPNPATATTTVTINFTIPQAGNVTLGIYDNKGVQVKILTPTFLDPLTGKWVGSLSGLIKGTYYVRLTLISPGIPAQTISVKFLIK